MTGGVRAFVAVWPSPTVVSQLAAIDRPTAPGVRWTTRDKWHVTLRFLGQVPEEALAEVGQALSRLEAPGAVTAVAGPGVERLGISVLCVPVAGVDELAARVVALTAAIGEAVDPRPFRGHLTVARAGRGVSLRTLTGAPFLAAWPVDEVTLVASTRDPDGARYQVVGRYPLVSDGLEGRPVPH